MHAPPLRPAAVTAGWSLRLQRDLSQVSLDEVGESKAVPNSTHSPASEEVDDSQQYDGTKQRGHQAIRAEVVLVDGATAEHGRNEPGSKQRSNHTHNRIQQRTLLSITAHDRVRHPADQPAHDWPNDEAHDLLLLDANSG